MEMFVTVSYNIKIFLIGEIANDHKKRVQNGVTECWRVERIDSGLDRMKINNRDIL